MTPHSVTYLLVPGITVEAKFTEEMVQPGPFDRVPDPLWQFVDAAGHGHFAAMDGKRVTYPTLREMEVEPAWIDEDGEEIGPVTGWECPVCGERVKPGTRAAQPFSVGRHVTHRLVIDEASVLREYELSESEWAGLESAVGDAVETVVDGMTPSRMEIRPL